MGVELKRRLIHVEDYQQMIRVGIFDEDERIELLNGEIIEMSPVGDLHIGTINWLNSHLNYLLAGKAIISIQNPIRIGSYSEPEPDIVICKMVDHFYKKQKASPADIYLVIEVADSTLEKDRKVKLQLYAEGGIGNYWIINLIEEQVEVYAQPSNGHYNQHHIAKSGDSLLIPGFEQSLDVSEIFA